MFICTAVSGNVVVRWCYDSWRLLVAASGRPEGGS